MTVLMINYVYIASLPRSGSTLLSMLLGSHDALFALGEFVLFGQAVQQNASCSCGKPIRECDFWNPIIEKLDDMNLLRDRGNGLFFNTMVYPFDFRESRIQKGLTNIFFHALGTHCRFWMDIATIDKMGYPFHMQQALKNSLLLLGILSRSFSVPGTILLDASKTVTRLDQVYLEQRFPVKVIALVRDGRGTVNSWLKDGQTGFADAVRSWRFHMERQQRCLKSIQAEDKLLVRYEDLCRDPEVELMRVCDFLHLSFHGKMMFMEGPFHMLGGNPGTIERARMISLDTGWKQRFDQEQLALFDELAGTLNEDLGYERN